MAASLVLSIGLVLVACGDDAQEERPPDSEVEPNNTLLDALPLGELTDGDSVAVSGNLSTGDIDWFLFTVADDHLKVRIRVESDADIDPDFVVLAGDGIPHVFCWTVQTRVAQATSILEHGSYLVRLAPRVGGESPYRLTVDGQEVGALVDHGSVNSIVDVEPNDPVLGYAQPLPGGQEWLVEGSLGGETGLVDVFLVPAQSGTLGVTASWDGSEDVDMMAIRSWEDGVWGFDWAGQGTGVNPGQEYFWAALNDEPLPKAVAVMIYIHEDTQSPFHYKLHLQYELDE